MNKPLPSSLKRIVGVGFGVAITIGGGIGVGILRMPAIVAGYTTNHFLFMFFWILGGGIALLGASIYAELGTRFPVAGGPFVFAQKGFGNSGAFLTGCSDWFFNVSATSYLSIAIAEYLNRLMKWDLPLGLSASLITIFFVTIQWQGLKSSSTFQKVMSVMTALCMLVFVIACFGYYFTTDQTTSVSPDPVTSFSWVAIFVLSIRSVFLTYTGWNSSVYFIEEDTNPQQHLPRSLIYGVVSVIIIYTLLNLGLIAVLPLAEMAKSNLPAAEAASLIFGDSGGMVITLIAIVSLIACLGATMLIAARILFAVARAGLIFKSFGDLNANAIPGKALLMTAFISILFSSTGLFNVVVNMGALFAMIADLSVYISILFIRPKNLSIKAPYQAWAYPWGPVTMVIITLGLIIGLFMEDTRICLYVLGALACVFPFYFIVRRNAKFDKPVIN